MSDSFKAGDTDKLLRETLPPTPADFQSQAVAGDAVGRERIDNEPTQKTSPSTPFRTPVFVSTAAEQQKRWSPDRRKPTPTTLTAKSQVLFVSTPQRRVSDYDHEAKSASGYISTRPYVKANLSQSPIMSSLRKLSAPKSSANFPSPSMPITPVTANETPPNETPSGSAPAETTPEGLATAQATDTSTPTLQTKSPQPDPSRFVSPTGTFDDILGSQSFSPQGQREKNAVLSPASPHKSPSPRTPLGASPPGGAPEQLDSPTSPKKVSYKSRHTMPASQSGEGEHSKAGTHVERTKEGSRDQGRAMTHGQKSQDRSLYGLRSQDTSPSSLTEDRMPVVSKFTTAPKVRQRSPATQRTIQAQPSVGPTSSPSADMETRTATTPPPNHSASIDLRPAQEPEKDGTAIEQDGSRGASVQSPVMRSASPRKTVGLQRAVASREDLQMAARSLSGMPPLVTKPVSPSLPVKPAKEAPVKEAPVEKPSVKHTPEEAANQALKKAAEKPPLSNNDFAPASGPTSTPPIANPPSSPETPPTPAPSPATPSETDVATKQAPTVREEATKEEPSIDAEKLSPGSKISTPQNAPQPKATSTDVDEGNEVARGAHGGSESARGEPKDEGRVDLGAKATGDFAPDGKLDFRGVVPMSSPSKDSAQYVEVSGVLRIVGYYDESVTTEFLGQRVAGQSRDVHSPPRAATDSHADGQGREHHEGLGRRDSRFFDHTHPLSQRKVSRGVVRQQSSQSREGLLRSRGSTESIVKSPPRMKADDFFQWTLRNGQEDPAVARSRTLLKSWSQNSVAEQKSKLSDRFSSDNRSPEDDSPTWSSPTEGSPDANVKSPSVRSPIIRSPKVRSPDQVASPKRGSQRRDSTSPGSTQRSEGRRRSTVTFTEDMPPDAAEIDTSQARQAETRVGRALHDVREQLMKIHRMATSPHEGGMVEEMESTPFPPRRNRRALSLFVKPSLLRTQMLIDSSDSEPLTPLTPTPRTLADFAEDLAATRAKESPTHQVLHRPEGLRKLSLHAQTEEARKSADPRLSLSRLVTDELVHASPLTNASHSIDADTSAQPVHQAPRPGATHNGVEPDAQGDPPDQASLRRSTSPKTAISPPASSPKKSSDPGPSLEAATQGVARGGHLPARQSVSTPARRSRQSQTVTTLRKTASQARVPVRTQVTKSGITRTRLGTQTAARSSNAKAPSIPGRTAFGARQSSSGLGPSRLTAARPRPTTARSPLGRPSLLRPTPTRLSATLARPTTMSRPSSATRPSSLMAPRSSIASRRSGVGVGTPARKTPEARRTSTARSTSAARSTPAARKTPALRSSYLQYRPPSRRPGMTPLGYTRRGIDSRRGVGSTQRRSQLTESSRQELLSKVWAVTDDMPFARARSEELYTGVHDAEARPYKRSLNPSSNLVVPSPGETRASPVQTDTRQEENLESAEQRYQRWRDERRAWVELVPLGDRVGGKPVFVLYNEIMNPSVLEDARSRVSTLPPAMADKTFTLPI